MQAFFKPGSVVLFQGDSVTDCGRTREADLPLGNGYARKVADIYTKLFPQQQLTFINKGVSGSRSIDLLERYEADFKDCRPDFISLLIGVNDVWRRFDRNMPTTAQEFFDHCDTYIHRLRSDFPQAKLMMLEPFVRYSLPDRRQWRDDLNEKIEAYRFLAEKYADYYVPLDGLFTQWCCSGFTQEQLLPDGVHPSEQGHSLIAQEYLKTLHIL